MCVLTDFAIAPRPFKASLAAAAATHFAKLVLLSGELDIKEVQSKGGLDTIVARSPIRLGLPPLIAQGFPPYNTAYCVTLFVAFKRHAHSPKQSKAKQSDLCHLDASIHIYTHIFTEEKQSKANNF